MNHIPPIPRRPTLADYTLTELAAILLRAAMAADTPTVRVVSRLIRERVAAPDRKAARP